MGLSGHASMSAMGWDMLEGCSGIDRGVLAYIFAGGGGLAGKYGKVRIVCGNCSLFALFGVG